MEFSEYIETRVSMENKIKNIINYTSKSKMKLVNYVMNNKNDFRYYFSETINRDDVQEEIELFLNAINEELFFLKSINLKEEQMESNMSIYYKNILEQYFNDLQNNYEHFSYDEYIVHHILNFESVFKRYSSLEILKSFSNIDKNIVLLGGNGSGKTLFANYLKGDDDKIVSVIPAQKSLYFKVYDSGLNKMTTEELSDVLLENQILYSKDEEYGNYEYYQSNHFTQLLLAMKQNLMEYLLDIKFNENQKGSLIKDEVIFFKIERVFSELFPEIEIKVGALDRETLKFSKNDQEYTVNGLSEGEKAVLYYSLNVLIAKSNSIIIVDEPETHLNPSITSKLWDLLIDFREDCQFIFITHSFDFIIGLEEPYLVWVEDFEYPNYWDFEHIDELTNIPKSLLTKVVGNRKPILFCEGDKENSLDYLVYRILFGDIFNIVPVRGHQEVITYTKAINESSVSFSEAYGIIDGDSNDAADKMRLWEENIFVLEFNEIEMMFFEREVMSSVMSGIYYEEADQKVEKFKEMMWTTFKGKVDTIALCRVKDKVDYIFSRNRVEKYQTTQDIEKSVDLLSKISVESMFAQEKEELESIIQEQDYSKLLTVCSLKNEISRGLANKYLDNDYMKKAIQHIKHNEDTRNYLKKEYFKLLNIVKKQI